MTLPWQELRARVRRAEHDEGQLAFLRGEVARLTRIREERARRLRAEAGDVDELEGLSLATLLGRLLGIHEARLERERSEELEAHLAHEQVKGELEKLGPRVSALEERAAERAEARRAFAEAMERRQAELAARGGAEAKRVEALAARLEEHERSLLEIDEARALCLRARDELLAAIDELDEAWGHGAADLFAAGFHSGRSAAEGKGAALARSQGHVQEAAVLLRQLDGELVGTGVRFDPRIGLPEGASIADWFLDNVITDWLTLRRLSGARERVGQVLEAVRALELSLSQSRTAREHALARDRRKLEERLRTEA